jgi:dolichol-phosphate mannosyltransferase
VVGFLILVKKMNMKACIILPTYNERENISRLIPALLDVFKSIRDWDMRILVVDDNSPDGTASVVKEFAKKHKNIHLLIGQKKGLGAAYVRGFKLVIDKIDVVIMMDADFSHNPEKIPEFLKQIEKGYDFVIGSRYIKGGATPDWSLIRKIISGGGNFFARVVVGLRPHDCTSGYRAIRTSFLKKVDFKNIGTRGYAFQATLLYELSEIGARIKEIPVVFYDRKVGKTKLGKKDIIEFLFNAFRLRLKSLSR